VLSGLYFVYILTRASLKPSVAPPMQADEINLRPSNRGNILLFFAMVAGLLVLTAASEEIEVGGGQVNWALIAFLTIFVASMWIGKREGDTLLGGILKGFVPPIFLIIMVLGSIFAGWATPTEAAGVGAFGSLVLAFVNGTLTFDVLRDVCHRTGLTTAMIFFIFVGATAFSTLFRNVYGEDLIIELIEYLELTPWHLLFILMLAIFLLGFFFDFLEIVLIILPVFDPIIRSMAGTFAPHLGLEVPEGASLIQMQYVQEQVIYWFAILVAVNLQTSFLTPPFGFALFYMKGVAPSSVRMQEIYQGIVPFVTLQVIGLMITLAFPELALMLPRLMLA
jgi:TRAP-type mannitol/chloroaromatic compound transport system permease large subunit